MHASRKLQRINNDGFKTHQNYNQNSKYNSKRDYERDASRSSSNYGRGDRDCSPNGTLNGTYRSDSPDMDRDRDRDHRDRDRDRDRDRYQSSSYFTKMRDKDRDRDYKKDKYSDSLRSPKRGRDREMDRTNHDRRTTNKYPISDKRGNSDERDKDRNDRDRDRDRERSSNSSGLDRGGGGNGGGGGGGGGDRERIQRIGDWSEHVSSSGKKYYYNCKTEVSQWEKPREWIEKERNLAKESQHRDYRDKDRCDRDRSDDRYSSSSKSTAYGKSQQQLQHSNSRGNSRGSRWPQETSTVTDGPLVAHRRRHDDQDMDISPGDSTPTSETSYSHSSTPTGGAAHTNSNNNANNHNATNSNLNNEGPVLLSSALPRLTSNPSTTPTNLLMNLSSQQQQQQQMHFQAPGGTSLLTCNTLASTKLSNSSLSNSGIVQQHHMQHHHHSNSTNNMSSTSSPTTHSTIGNSLSVGNSMNNSEMMMSSNTPGPPISMAGLPKILSQITGNKQLDQNDINPQKALQTINNALLRHGSGGGDMLGNNSNNMRDPHNSMNSPLYNIAHLHSMSAASTINSYSSTTTILGQTNLINSNNGLNSGDPPTPTQESELLSDHRKMDNLSQPQTSSVSSLQSVMTSSQAGRSQGPNLTPSLANYCRADLIGHITGWPADMLEKQAQKCSEEAHLLGDLQCSKVSTDLKCARSLVRITEITATLQEQKIMYLRQQIRRLEELKSKNSFMSGDL